MGVANTSRRTASPLPSSRTPKTSRSGCSVSSTAKPSRRNSGFQASSTASPAGALSRSSWAIRTAVPDGTVDLPTTREARSSRGASSPTTLLTWLMSAAYSPFFCGVPAQMKCTSPNSATSSYDVVKRTLPLATVLRSSSSRPGS